MNLAVWKDFEVMLVLVGFVFAANFGDIIERPKLLLFFAFEEAFVLSAMALALKEKVGLFWLRRLLLVSFSWISVTTTWSSSSSISI